jgi:regulator of protease activity HflC (stomatin/prohibitin superfamily)
VSFLNQFLTKNKFTMITFIGAVFILAAIGVLVWQKIYENAQAENARLEVDNQKIREENQNRDRYSQLPLKTLNNVPKPITDKHWLLATVGVAVMLLNGMFFWANSGTAYAVQYPWGGDSMVVTQGIKFQGWGRTIPLSYDMSIQDVIIKRKSGETDEEYQERRKKVLKAEDGIYNRQASEWEFSDAIKADIATAVIVGIDIKDEESFLTMADRNRSEAKLIYGRVIPNINAALKNTAKLMDAQEYISGKASDFDRYFKDQLENGMYLVEEYTEAEDQSEIIGDTTTVRKISNMVGSNNNQTKYRIKRDSQGNIMRDPSSNTLTQYGIKIHQAQVTGIDWESSFDERLQLQKEQVAQTQLEKQEAEKEFYRAKKEIAKGESEKAAERARLEKEQIKLTIAAETEAKVAEQNVIAERKKYEVEQLRAKSTKVAADAEAYKNQRLVSAGLTPQERAEWEYKTKIGVAKELKSLQLPATYIEGSSGNNGSSLLENLIGAEMAKGMLNTKK